VTTQAPVARAIEVPVVDVVVWVRTRPDGRAIRGDGRVHFDRHVAVSRDWASATRKGLRWTTWPTVNTQVVQFAQGAEQQWRMLLLYPQWAP
jgi:hypothetical protein